MSGDPAFILKKAKQSPFDLGTPIAEQLVVCRIPPLLLLFFSLSFLHAGCDGNGDTDPGIDEDVVWLGSSAHLSLSGVFNGEELDFTIDDSSIIDDALAFYCEREWEVPNDSSGTPDYENGKLVEFKIRAPVTIGSENRIVELEFKQHDFQSQGIGTSTTVIPRDDLVTAAPGEMWFEFEWHDELDATTYEAAATEGVFRLEAFSGETDGSGLIIPEGEGHVGGTLHARWSVEEAIDVSFYFPCTSNQIAILE